MVAKIRQSSVFLGVGFALLFGGACCLPVCGAPVYDSNGFEPSGTPAFTVGNVSGQNGWSVNYTASAVTVETSVVRSGLQAVAAQRTAGNTNSCYFEPTFTATTGLVRVQASIRVNDMVVSGSNFDALYVTKTGTGSDRQTILYFYGDGKVKVYNGGTNTQVSTWTAGNWYDVDFLFDTTAKKFNLAINGSTVATNFSFLENTATSVNRIVFQEYGGQAGSTMYVDNVLIVIPEPAALGLLGLGALMVLRRRR